MGRFLAPEIVQKCHFLAPEIFIMTQLFFWPQKSSKWDYFWLQKSSKNDDFWPQKSSLWLNFISGPRNRQNGTISGPRNRQSDQEILYEIKASQYIDINEVIDSFFPLKQKPSVAGNYRL